MTNVADEAKQNKFFRFLHGVSERALKGSLDIEQFIRVVQVLLDKKARATNLAEYIAQGCPVVDYVQTMPRAKIRRQKPPELVVDLDTDPFIPEGWAVKGGDHQKGGQFSWDSAAVELWLSPNQQNSKHIEGNKLRKELANQPVLNANVLDFLLANPDIIPMNGKAKPCFSGARFIAARVAVRVYGTCTGSAAGGAGMPAGWATTGLVTIPRSCLASSAQTSVIFLWHSDP